MMFRRVAAPAVAAVVAVAVLAGCSGKPENSPAIRKKFAEIEQMQNDMKESTKTLHALAGDVTVIKDQISSLKALAPGGEEGAAVLKRLEEIEKRLTGAAGTTPASIRTSPIAPAVPATAATASARPAAPVAGLTPAAFGRMNHNASAQFGGLATPVRTADAGTTATTATAATAAAAAPARPAAEAAKAQETTKPETRTASRQVAKPDTKTTTAKARETSKSGGETKTASKPAAKPAERQVASAAGASNRGRYHTIQAGDTLEALATANGMSVDALKKANNLPEGSRPLRGQRLFIPGKSN